MYPIPLQLPDPHEFPHLSLIVVCSFECNVVHTGCWGLSPTTNPSPTLCGCVSSTQPKDHD